MPRYIFRVGFFFISCFVMPFAKAQDPCATDLYRRQLRLNNAEIAQLIQKNQQWHMTRAGRKESLPEVIIIPVVFHVLYHESDTEIGVGTNISEERLRAQIQVLNEDFRRKEGSRGFNNHPDGTDTKIEFCLASTDPNCLPTTGITRHKVTKTTFDAFKDDYLIKSHGYWPNTDYLNIWVASLASGFIGYTQFPNYSRLKGIDSINGVPATDGVVVATKTVGIRTSTSAKDVYIYGRTVTHEVGHWLGLLHTWGDENCGTDYVEDTPPCESGNLGFTCPNIFPRCGTGQRQMIENYLDYSPDVCMNIFTNGQAARMREALAKSPDRNALIYSKGCQKFFTLVAPVSISPKESEHVKIIPTGSHSWAIENAELLVAGRNPPLTKVPIRFETAFINFNNLKSGVLSFDVAYADALNTDSLSVELYAGCNATNLYVGSLHGGLLKSTERLSGYPSDEQFKYVQLKIPNDAPKFGKLVFTYFPNVGNPLYLRNILIADKNENFGVYAVSFDKPYKNIFKLNSESHFDANTYSIRMRVQFSGPSSVDFAVYNANGNLVISQQHTNAFSNTFSIPAVHLPPGLYLVRTSAAGQTAVNRIIVYR